MLIMTVFYACTFDRELVLDDENLTLSLRWIPGLEIETQDEMKTGLAWTLSMLGASLPAGSLNSAIVWHNDTHFDLNLNKVGFNKEALKALSTIRRALVESEEYTTVGSINLGRFVMLTLNSTNHYYEITGIPETLREFRSLYDFQQKRLLVVNSSISSVDRLIETAEAESFVQIAHIGSESGQPFSAGEFMPIEFETIDVMPNGFLRFGLYGSDRRLKTFANEAFTSAGKPAKCAWCHEQSILPLFLADPVITLGNSLTREAFIQLQREQMEVIRAYRSGLNTDLDFSKPRDHERTEKIYEDFMEPDAELLAREWGLSIEATQSMLSGIENHDRQGMPGFYHRKDVDALAPYAVVRVPESAREKSSYEPDFF